MALSLYYGGFVLFESETLYRDSDAIGLLDPRPPHYCRIYVMGQSIVELQLS